MKGTLSQELDFENEGRNSERCAEELKHFKFVVVPKVFWDVTSKVGMNLEMTVKSFYVYGLQLYHINAIYHTVNVEGPYSRVLRWMQNQQRGGDSASGTEPQRREFDGICYD